MLACTYDEFLTRVIDDGIAAANADYAQPFQAPMRAGAISGFEACRSCTPAELVDLLTAKNRECIPARDEPIEDYWRIRCAALEIEWVCNVVSAFLVNEGQPPLTGYLPTARGMLKAAEIIGVAEQPF